MPLTFYTGVSEPAHLRHVQHGLLSLRRLTRRGGRKSRFPAHHWMLDSGAFTEVERHGKHTTTVVAYADMIERFRSCGTLDAAVCQDYVCTPAVRLKWGYSVDQAQMRTIIAYAELRAELDRRGVDTYVMPVLQGWEPADYTRHLMLYARAGHAISPEAWVGVGSVQPRSRDAGAVLSIIAAIHRRMPGLRLHLFGVKSAALFDAELGPVLREAIHTADSAAWSAAARFDPTASRQARNDGRLAGRYERQMRERLTRADRAASQTLTLF